MQERKLKVRYCRPCQKVGLASPQGTRKRYFILLSNSRNFSKKNVIIHGKSPAADYVVTAVDYGIMSDSIAKWWVSIARNDAQTPCHGR
jgi:hypothetical protein